MSWAKKGFDFGTENPPPETISFYFARVPFDILKKVEEKRIKKGMSKMGVILRMMELYLKDKKGG